MNYVYQPTVAAKIASWVNYIPPVVGTRDASSISLPRWRTTSSPRLADNR